MTTTAGANVKPQDESRRAGPGLERMPTGIPGLDHLLQGGLVRGNSLLVEGPPGSGKSSLAIRVLYEGIQRFGEPGLIITFEEFPKQLYADALEFGCDLRAAEESGMLRVVWTPPNRILEGFSGKNDLVGKLIEDLGVRRLVIDSITHFKRVSAQEQELREILGRVLNNLKITGINAILLKELERVDEETIAFEEYLVDASARLYNLPSAGGGENVRQIEIRKTRGQGHISGRHPIELGAGGFHVYPRLRPKDTVRLLEDVPKPPRTRVPLGVEGIDRMLHGGWWSSSLNLVAGAPGTGKSVLAYHFTDTGLRAGEPCLFLSIKNSPEQILAQAESLHMDWRAPHQSGQLRIHHHHPTGLCVERLMNALVNEIHQDQPRRLVFDSVDDLWSAVKDEDRVRDYILTFASLFEAAGTTSMLLNEVRHMGGARTGDVQDYSYLASSVVQLSIQTVDAAVHRFVSVAKHSGSDHAKEVNEYSIDANGMHVPVASVSGA